MTLPRLSRGFSLIELMITVSILFLLLMMALPAFNRWMSNVQIRNMGESLQNGLRLAQLEAAKRNSTATFTLTSDAAPSCSSTASTSGVNWVICADSSVIQTHLGIAGNATASVASDFSSVSFDGLGRSNLTAASKIEITSSVDTCESATATGVRCLRLMMSTGGKVRLCDPLVDAGDPAACS
jgi:type IV fimbrial biogenesis protein FimT